jgi:hypothetical protein
MSDNAINIIFDIMLYKDFFSAGVLFDPASLKATPRQLGLPPI